MLYFFGIQRNKKYWYYDNKEIHAIKCYFWLRCTFWVSYWHIKCKINWERTFKRLHNWALYQKDCFFLGSSKEVQKEPPEVLYKKRALKNSTIFAEKHLCQSPCNFIKKRLQPRCFPVNIVDILRATFLQNNSSRLLLKVESENISQRWLNHFLQEYWRKSVLAQRTGRWYANVLSCELCAFCALCTFYLVNFVDFFYPDGAMRHTAKK